MTEQTMRIDDALSRSVAALEKGAAALERIANELENYRKGADAVRGQLEQTTSQLERGLQMVTALVASVAGAVDQAAEEKADESDEGQRPQPVAVEAPAKPEPPAKAEPAPAPVEAKQEEQEKPAAAEPVETASEDKAEQAVAPEESASAAAPGVDLPDLDVSAYLKTMQELNRKYSLSEDLRKHIQHGIREELGIKALVQCEPKMRRRVVGLYEAALKRLEKEGLTAEAPLR